MDQDVTKKLKGLENSGRLALEATKSSEQNRDGLTDEADGNTQADHHTQGKNGSESMRSADNDVKVHTQVRSNTAGDGNYTTPTHLVPVSLGSPYEKIGISTTFSAGERLPFDAMVLDEKQLKREKRKQANRESARRSRMRKQAEYEELVKSCDSLSTEQMDLKSELDQLKADAKKLRLENAALREQLKNAQVMQEGGIASTKTEVGFALPNGAKDILSNLGSVSSNDQLDRETHETSISETITRLHQMLESSSRTDAVAAR